MNDVTRDVKALLGDMWNDIQRSARSAQLRRIRENPESHRLTRMMAPGKSTNYTWWDAGRQRKSKRLEHRFHFCVAKNKNAAGVFLIWRQVDTWILAKGKWRWTETARFDFQWAPTKAEACAIAERKAERCKLDVAHAAAAKLPDAPAAARAMLDDAIG